MDEFSKQILERIYDETSGEIFVIISGGILGKLLVKLLKVSSTKILEESLWKPVEESLSQPLKKSSPSETLSKYLKSILMKIINNT